MKTNSNIPFFAIERKMEILKMLDENSKVLVQELCDIFEVSSATIRNDLRELEAEGTLKRTHGGAIPIGKAGFEPNSKTKEIENIEKKQQIAAYAARFVEDGDTIALDTGTTTMEFAKYLIEKKHLTIVTNDIKIANFLELNSNAGIVLIGGEVRRGFHCTTGAMALSGLSGLNVDKAFMAANAFSLEKGFTTPSFVLASVKQALISISTQTIMLVDSSKIGKISFVKFADASEIDLWITDSDFGRKPAAMIREQYENLELYMV